MCSLTPQCWTRLEGKWDRIPCVPASQFFGASHKHQRLKCKSDMQETCYPPMLLPHSGNRILCSGLDQPWAGRSESRKLGTNMSSALARSLAYRSSTCRGEEQDAVDCCKDLLVMACWTLGNSQACVRSYNELLTQRWCRLQTTQ